MLNSRAAGNSLAETQVGEMKNLVPSEKQTVCAGSSGEGLGGSWGGEALQCYSP